MIPEFLKFILNSFLIRKGAIALSLRLLSAAGNYLLLLYIARHYGPDNLGIYTLSWTLLQFFSLLAVQGLDLYLVRITPVVETKQKNSSSVIYIQSLFWVLLSSCVLMMAGNYLFPLLAESVFHKKHLIGPFSIIAFAIIPFAVITLNASAFRSRKNMTGYFIFNAFIGFLTLLVFAATQVYFTLIPLLISIILLSLGSLTAWFFYARINLNYSFILPFKLNIKSALPMLITGLTFFAMGYADNLFLGAFCTTAELGVYDVAFKLATAITIFLQAINSVQGPLFAELHANNQYELLQQKLNESNKLVFLISIPALVVLALFAAPILNLFGEGFKESYFPLLILIGGNLINCLCGSVGVVMQMTGRQIIYNRIVITAALCGIVSLYLLVPVYNTIGASISVSIMLLIQNLVSVLYLKRMTGITCFYFPFLK